MIFAPALTLALQAATIQWGALPLLPYRTPPVVTAEMHAFVAHEVAARRCPLPDANGGAATLTVDVAVRVAEDGTIRAAIPRAIQCPTVEQYSAALVTAFARNNLLPRLGAQDQWYRTAVTFNWTP